MADFLADRQVQPASCPSAGQRGAESLFVSSGRPRGPGGGRGGLKGEHQLSRCGFGARDSEWLVKRPPQSSRWLPAKA